MVRKGARRDRGAAAVEFAIVVPLLLLLVFGIISYGIMLSFRQAVSQSAAEGARAAAVTLPGGDPHANAAEAVSQALGHGLSCTTAGVVMNGTAAVGSCTITPLAQCPANSSAACMQVVVSIDYSAASIGPTLPLVPMPHTLSYTAVSELN